LDKNKYLITDLKGFQVLEDISLKQHMVWADRSNSDGTKSLPSETILVDPLPYSTKSFVPEEVWPEFIPPFLALAKYRLSGGFPNLHTVNYTPKWDLEEAIREKIRCLEGENSAGHAETMNGKDGEMGDQLPDLIASTIRLFKFRDDVNEMSLIL
jgi:hypothetical protein